MNIYKLRVVQSCYADILNEKFLCHEMPGIFKHEVFICWILLKNSTHSVPLMSSKWKIPQKGKSVFHFMWSNITANNPWKSSLCISILLSRKWRHLLSHLLIELFFIKQVISRHPECIIQACTVSHQISKVFNSSSYCIHNAW